MNLMELMIKIGVDDQASKQIEGISQKSMGWAAGIGKAALGAGAAMVGAAATGAVALTKAAVAGYGEHEQLAGSIKKLYGAAYTNVMANGQRAWKTVGLSENEYLNTVINTSGSMLKAVEGDTWEAARLEDIMLQDMADNHNMLANSMESIQNAYRGFSRENYTMLDNLALGFSGTKAGMQELLAYAEQISGVHYELGNFADMVQAIHVVQQEMQITGTTADEAEKTITGSMAQVTAAWRNLVNGLADDNADIDALIDNVVQSASVAAQRVLPRIKTALVGIAKMVKEISPIIAEEVPSLITDVAPSFIEAAGLLITSFVDAISSNLDPILNTGIEIAMKLIDAIIDAAPTLVTAAAVIVQTLAEHILDPELLTTITNAAVSIIVTIANTLATMIPMLLPAVTTAITTIAEALLSEDNLQSIINAGMGLLGGIVQGMADALPQLTEQLPGIISAVTAFFLEPENLTELTNSAASIITAIVQGMTDGQLELMGATMGLIGAIGGQITAWLASGGAWQLGKAIAGGIVQGLQAGLLGALGVGGGEGSLWEKIFGTSDQLGAIDKFFDNLGGVGGEGTYTLRPQSDERGRVLYDERTGDRIYAVYDDTGRRVFTGTGDQWTAVHNNTATGGLPSTIGDNTLNGVTYDRTPVVNQTIIAPTGTPSEQQYAAMMEYYNMMYQKGFGGAG